MNRNVQALVTEIGRKIEVLIAAAVATRVAGAQKALKGLGVDDVAGPVRVAKRPAKKAGAKKRARPRTHRKYTPAERQRLIALANKPGANLSAIEKAEGMGKGTLRSWVKPHVGKGRRTRKSYEPDFKRKVVAKALVMAPGDRQTYLASEGITPGLYYDWVSWSKKNPG